MENTKFKTPLPDNKKTQLKLKQTPNTSPHARLVSYCGRDIFIIFKIMSFNDVLSTN